MNKKVRECLHVVCGGGGGGGGFHKKEEFWDIEALCFEIVPAHWKIITTPRESLFCQRRCSMDDMKQNINNIVTTQFSFLFKVVQNALVIIRLDISVQSSRRVRGTGVQFVVFNQHENNPGSLANSCKIPAGRHSEAYQVFFIFCMFSMYKVYMGLYNFTDSMEIKLYTHVIIMILY